MQHISDTILERIARLEAEVAADKRERAEMKTQLASMDTKLDTLLELKNKGTGAFWLATSLAGIGGITLFVNIMDWFSHLIGRG